MRSHFAVGLILLFAFAVCGQQSNLQTNPDAKSPDLIPVKLLYSPGVQGHLGAKLGTAVTVSAKVVDDGSFQKDGRKTIMIYRVNNQDLVDPFYFSFHTPYAGMPKELKKGQLLTLVGYETGAFKGEVENPLAKDELPVQKRYMPYGYYPDFIVLQVK